MHRLGKYTQIYHKGLNIHLNFIMLCKVERCGLFINYLGPTVLCIEIICAFIECKAIGKVLLPLLQIIVHFSFVLNQSSLTFNKILEKTY